MAYSHRYPETATASSQNNDDSFVTFLGLIFEGFGFIVLLHANQEVPT